MYDAIHHINVWYCTPYSLQAFQTVFAPTQHREVTNSSTPCYWTATTRCLYWRFVSCDVLFQHQKLILNYETRRLTHLKTSTLWPHTVQSDIGSFWSLLLLLLLLLIIIKRYNLYKVLACSTTFFHLTLSCVIFFQFRTFNLFISSETSSSAVSEVLYNFYCL